MFEGIFDFLSSFSIILDFITEELSHGQMRVAILGLDFGSLGSFSGTGASEEYDDGQVRLFQWGGIDSLK